MLALASAFGGCGGPERDSLPRYDFPVDAPEEDAVSETTMDDAPRSDATPDAASVEGDAAIDADADAGPIVLRAIATGSGEHPSAVIGNGDHTCVIAGPTRSLYCWGANDHGQIGNGKTGAGAFAEDVTPAAKIALDETGLAFDGLEEVSLAAWHSCARTHDLLFCWGQRFSGAQAEPPAAGNLDRTAPRAIGNFDVARIAAGRSARVRAEEGRLRVVLGQERPRAARRRHQGQLCLSREGRGPALSRDRPFVSDAG